MYVSDIYHYLHIVVFAVIVGIELPALYIMRLARAPGADAVTVGLAVRVKRWADTLSAFLLVLMLPLGVEIATTIGVYTLMSPAWLISTWIVALVWLGLVVASHITGSTALGRRLYTTEVAVRILIGLGNVYDAVVGFMGTGMIQTNWLATKILLFGLVLMVSGVVRWQTRAVRFADLGSDSTDQPDSQALLLNLRRAQWGSHAILFMVLMAAFMGTAKPW